jgi:hypothetical protein
MTENENIPERWTMYWDWPGCFMPWMAEKWNRMNLTAAPSGQCRSIIFPQKRRNDRIGSGGLATLHGTYDTILLLMNGIG